MDRKAINTQIIDDIIQRLQAIKEDKYFEELSFTLFTHAEKGVQSIEGELDGIRFMDKK